MENLLSVFPLKFLEDELLNNKKNTTLKDYQCGIVFKKTSEI